MTTLSESLKKYEEARSTYNQARQDAAKAEQYYDASRRCAKEKDCDDLLTIGFKEAGASHYDPRALKAEFDRCYNHGQCEMLSKAIAEHYGVDQELVSESFQCAHHIRKEKQGMIGSDSKEREVCDKAAAKIGGVIACTAFTGQHELCGKVAPVLVEYLWPIIGPTLIPGKMIEKALYMFVTGVPEALSHIGNEIANLVGFGRKSAGTDWNAILDRENDISWKIFFLQATEGIKSIINADVLSKIETGILGSLGDKTYIDIVNTNFKMHGKELGFIVSGQQITEIEMNKKGDIFNKVVDIFSKSLQKNRAFSQELALWANKKGTFPTLCTVNIAPGKVPLPLKFPTAPSNGFVGGTGVTIPAMPSGWSLRDNRGWTPSFMGYFPPDSAVNMLSHEGSYGKSKSGSVFLYQEFFSAVRAYRASAVSESISECIGQVIGINAKNAVSFRNLFSDYLSKKLNEKIDISHLLKPKTTNIDISGVLKKVRSFDQPEKISIALAVKDLWEVSKSKPQFSLPIAAVVLLSCALAIREIAK